MSIRVRIDGSGLADRAEASAQKATEAVMREVMAAFDQSFTAKAWDWPRNLPTRKLKGATLAEKIRSYRKGEGIKAGNPRNLIDVGSLRESKNWQMIGPYTAKFTWSTEYARLMHEGGTIQPWGNKRAAPVRLPARPWTAAVLGRVTVPGIRPFPIEQRLKDVWLAYFRSGRR